jgi:hypothetical protein
LLSQGKKQQSPGLCGDGGCNIPRVVELLVNASKTLMVDEETDKGNNTYNRGHASNAINDL